MSDGSEAKRRSYPEFFVLPFTAQTLAYSIHDEDGRPLGEMGASEEAREGVEFDYQACPYPGHRTGMGMNASALRQMSRNWKLAMADCAALRVEYLRRAGRDPEAEDPLDLYDLWWISTAGTSLPAYLVRRRDQPLADGQLPARVAVSFKMLIGLQVVVQRMFLLGMHSLDARADPTTYHAFAEQTGAFVAETRVCAGSPKMIDEFLNMTGRPRTPPEVPTALRDVVGDLAGFLRYADRITLFALTAAATVSAYHGAIEALARALDGIQVAPAQRLAALARRVLARRTRYFHPLLVDPARVLAVARAQWDREPEAPRPSRLLDGPAAPAPVDPDELARVETALAAAFPDAELRRVVALATIDQAALERDAAAHFTWLQGRCNESLGHAPPDEPLASEDLAPFFQGGAWDLVRATARARRRGPLTELATAAELIDRIDQLDASPRSRSP